MQTEESKKPITSWKKKKMQDWLKIKNIAYGHSTIIAEGEGARLIESV